jgi:hypothetical protein
LLSFKSSRRNAAGVPADSGDGQTAKRAGIPKPRRRALPSAVLGLLKSIISVYRHKTHKDLQIDFQFDA